MAQLALLNIKGSKNKNLKALTIQFVLEYFKDVINEGNKLKFACCIKYFPDYLFDSNFEVL